MGHQGKHLIDPETGLCEICDKSAIEDVQQGKPPGKKIIYTNLEDESTERLDIEEIPHRKDRYVRETSEKATPRSSRRSIHVLPQVQTHRIVYHRPTEESIVVQRKVVQTDHPSEQVVIRHSPPTHPPPPPPPPPRPTTYYYVDEESQMIPQKKPPPTQSPRRYVVERRVVPPSARSVRIVRRQIQTPPPPSSEIWHKGPRRQINSDTEIVQRQQRMRHNDANDTLMSQIRPEVYYLEAVPNNVRRTPIETPVFASHDENSPLPPPPRIIHQNVRNRRPNQINLPERRNPRRVEPVVVKRVYKSYPPSRLGPPDHHLGSDENRTPIAMRQKGQNPLPPPPAPSKRFQTAPEINKRRIPVKHDQFGSESDTQYPPPAKKPSIFYIRNRQEYE